MDEAEPSCCLKQPRIEQRWHGNLQRAARVLIILLQIGCVEPKTQEVIFEGSFESFNDEQYTYCMRPIKGHQGHQSWLKRLIMPFAKADRTDFVATIIKRILKFLQMDQRLP